MFKLNNNCKGRKSHRLFTVRRNGFLNITIMFSLQGLVEVLQCAQQTWPGRGRNCGPELPFYHGKTIASNLISRNLPFLNEKVLAEALMNHLQSWIIPNQDVLSDDLLLIKRMILYKKNSLYIIEQWIDVTICNNRISKFDDYHCSFKKTAQQTYLKTFWGFLYLRKHGSC